MASKSGTRSTSRSRAKPTTTRSKSRTTSASAKTTKSPAAPTSARKRGAAPAAAKVEPKVVEVKAPVVAKPELKKQELIDLVVARSGAKKKDAKPVIEAALAVLGEALADGRELNLRPMGKLKISRREEKANGTVIICRVRQPLGQATPSDDDPTRAPRIQAAE